MKKSVILLLGIILLSTLISAGNLSISVTPKSGGRYCIGTTFDYVLNFTTNSDCSGVLLSHDQTITTDEAGRYVMSIDISGLTQVPSYLCEYRDGSLRKTHDFSDIVFNTIYARNLNLSGNLNISGDIRVDDIIADDITADDIGLVDLIIGGIIEWGVDEYFDYNSITSTFIFNLAGDEYSFGPHQANFYDNNITTTGNISIDGYYFGQPLDGSIGSGIINASENKVHCGCINVTDEGGLNVKYPDMKVKIWNYGINTYCDISGTTVTVTDNQHSVYYVDSACAVQSDIWNNYFAFDLNPANYVKIFDVYARNGDIEVVKGGSVIGLIGRKTKWMNVNCGVGGHLAVCDGINIEENTFSDINQTSGHYNYINTVHTSVFKQASVDGIHLVHHTGGVWSHTDKTGLNLSHCDDGTDLVACSDNKYRRYIVYTLGFGIAGTQIHQLAASDTETYATLSSCLNVESNPLSYTLPTGEDSVAVVHHFYCGKRDDTAWRDGWVDIRVDVRGFGALPDLSIFVTYTEANQNLDLGNYNLTASWLNITADNWCNQTNCYTLSDFLVGGASGIWTNVSGTATYGDNVNITGNLTLGQKITSVFNTAIEFISVTWTKITSSLWVDNNLNVTGTLNVSGNATFIEDVTIEGTLHGGSPLRISGGIELIGANATITGNTTIINYIGFPTPNYDSGWVNINQGEVIELNHNLGGDNVNNYLVEIQGKILDGNSHIRHLGEVPIGSEKIIYINYTQTHDNNLALNSTNSEFSDNVYASFDVNHDPLYRIQGSHDGTNLGLITNVEAFIEYYTVDIENDYAYVTFYNPDFGTKYSISLRKIEAREEEGIQYEGRGWNYGLPPWSYFSSSNLIGKVVGYGKVGGPDNGIFYIDKIGFKVTYIPTVGIWWSELTADTIKIARGNSDWDNKEVRIRIWVYE